jgi:putative ABC transport system substrate-binding protein
LVRLQPEIVMTQGTPATAALQQETRTIPIVASVAEPVASGIVPGLKEPGGTSPASPSTKPRWQASGLSCSRRSLPA